ncbi:hypothetical protein [Klebsiella pneumoniae]
MADVLEGFIPKENMENLRVEFALKVAAAPFTKVVLNFAILRMTLHPVS